MAVEAITDEARLSRPDIPEILKLDLHSLTRELREAAADPEVNRVVVASEYFSVADPHRVRFMFKDISLHDAVVVLVLRRQDRLIESGYGQEVMEMGSTNIIGQPRYNRKLDWQKLISNWSSAFGAGSLRIFIYDDLVKAPTSMVIQLFSLLGDDVIRLVTEEESKEVRTHESFPAALIEFKRLANLAGAPEVFSLLEQARQRSIGGAPFRMEPKRAKAFLDLYRDSNRQLAQTFLNKEGDLFDETDLDSSSGGLDLTGKLPTETLATLFALYFQQQETRFERVKAQLTQAHDLLQKASRALSESTSSLRQQSKESAEQIEKIQRQFHRLNERPNSGAVPACSQQEAGLVRRMLTFLKIGDTDGRS
jgi:hypothetical protein